MLEKTLVDANGDVVVDNDEKVIKASKDSEESAGKDNKRVHYKDMSLFERIKTRRNGYIIRVEDGRRAAYIFSGMYSVDWFYIEKIDLEKFLAERNIQVPWGLSPEG